MQHEGKLAVVTGGERGIGRGIVERLLNDGWRVVVLGIDDDAAKSFRDDLALKAPFEFIHCDVAEEAAVADAFDAIEKRWGLLDGLALNAGIASPERKPIRELSLDEWQSVIQVNLTGPFLCAKHAASRFVASGGSIVTVASTRAAMSEANTFAYSASKGGLVSLTHALAISLGPAIRANAISPGWIHTGSTDELSDEDHRQHPAGRVGLPADIAGLASYLLGPDSSFVTGQNFVVDGGMTKKMIYV